MATRRLSLAKGATEFSLVEAVGAATVTADCELTFDTAVNSSQQDYVSILNRLDMFKNYITGKMNKPPS